jgi:hypothetical protein
MAKENIIGYKIELWYENSNADRQCEFNDLPVSDLKLQIGLNAIHWVKKGVQDSK